jgi:hypothetical protein
MKSIHATATATTAISDASQTGCWRVDEQVAFESGIIRLAYCPRPPGDVMLWTFVRSDGIVSVILSGTPPHSVNDAAAECRNFLVLWAPSRSRAFTMTKGETRPMMIISQPRSSPNGSGSGSRSF